MFRIPWCFGLVLWAGLSFAPSARAAGGSHPHFDDQGTLSWHTRWSDALQSARGTGKLILVEFGRLRCSSCRTLVSEVIPDPKVQARLSKVAVGLAADCDTPEEIVDRLFAKHLPGADMLPFVAFLTPEGNWIRGFAGSRGVTEFLADLSAAERTLSTERTLAAERSATTPGLPKAHVPERPQPAPAPLPATYVLASGDLVPAPAAPAAPAHPTPAGCAPQGASAAQRAWAEAQFAYAVSAARLRRHDEALAAAHLVRTSMPGEPEALEAARGIEAIETTRELARLDPRGLVATTLARNAAERTRGTRWELLFR